MDVEIPAWNTCTFRSDGAFAVWTVAKDGSLHNIIGPSRSTDRTFNVRTYGVPVKLRVQHKEPVSVQKEMIERKPDHEVLDKTPIEVPLMPAPTLQQRIDYHLKIALERQAERDGFDSPEEAMDFDVDEDPDPVSQYELTDMQDEVRSPDLINDLRGPRNADRKAEEPVPGTVSTAKAVERGPEEERDSSSGESG